MTNVTDRQRKATREFMLRVAREKIRIHGLKDTPEEYVRKSMERVS